MSFSTDTGPILTLITGSLIYSENNRKRIASLVDVIVTRSSPLSPSSPHEFSTGRSAHVPQATIDTYRNLKLSMYRDIMFSHWFRLVKEKKVSKLHVEPDRVSLLSQETGQALVGGDLARFLDGRARTMIPMATATVTPSDGWSASGCRSPTRRCADYLRACADDDNEEYTMAPSSSMKEEGEVPGHEDKRLEYDVYWDLDMKHDPPEIPLPGFKSTIGASNLRFRHRHMTLGEKMESFRANVEERGLDAEVVLNLVPVQDIDPALGLGPGDGNGDGSEEDLMSCRRGRASASSYSQDHDQDHDWSVTRAGIGTEMSETERQEVRRAIYLQCEQCSFW